MTPLRTIALWSVGLGLLVSGAHAADATKNDQGIEWIHTTDHWGVPFGDGATMFYAGVEQHRRWLAEQGTPPEEMAFAVGTETSLRKVFRPKWWFRGQMTGQVDIAAAQGEAEGVQLVVFPIAPMERTITRLSPEKDHKVGPLQPATVAIKTVTATDLTGPGGATIPASSFEISRVGFIKTVLPQYPVMNVGDWPDQLLPMGPFEVANPFCQPLWVDVRVPRKARPGDYTGQIHVDGPHRVTIRVKLTVWPFAMPAKRSYVTMGWSLNPWFVKDGADAFMAKASVLLDHGLAPWHACVKLAKDLDAHDRVFRWLQSRGVRLQAMTTTKPDPNYVEHLRKRGWLKHFICIPGDEPHERDYPTYRKRAEAIRKQFPGLTVAMSEDPQPVNKGMFDLWITEPSAHRHAWVTAAQQRGDRIWWYMCQLPIHATYPGPIWGTPGVVADRPAVDHRVAYWLAWKYRIEGVGFWAISAWPKGWEKWPDAPWPVNPLMKFPYGGQHNANGFLCYPYRDRVLPSLRLKVLRDGMDDYEYLRLLETRTRGRAVGRDRELLDIPPAVAMGLRYYNKDPNAILAARREIAARIAALSK